MTSSDLPRRFRISLPDAVLRLSERERRRRARCTDYEVVLDDCRFFARGLLTIPIQEDEEPFVVDCWAEVAERAHLVIVCTGGDAEREDIVPLAARLASVIPPFYQVIGSPALIQVQPIGHLPEIILQGDCPLTHIQREGLMPAEFRAIAIDLLNQTQGALSSLTR